MSSEVSWGLLTVGPRPLRMLGSPAQSHGLADPAGVPIPRLLCPSPSDDFDVFAEPLREPKPFGAIESLVGEFFVPTTLEPAVAPFEREEIVVPDRPEPLSRVRSGADLHAVVEPEIVDDVDARGRQLPVDELAVHPFAHCAEPRRGVAHPESRPAQATWRREHICEPELARSPFARDSEVSVAQIDGCVRRHRGAASVDRAMGSIGGHG